MLIENIHDLKQGHRMLMYLTISVDEHVLNFRFSDNRSEVTAEATSCVC